MSQHTTFVLQAQGAEVVIALTHMRVPNDKVLAAAVPEIDLILGESSMTKLYPWLGAHIWAAQLAACGPCALGFATDGPHQEGQVCHD